MFGRCLFAGIIIAFALILTLSVCAEEYELQLEVLDMRQAKVNVRGQYLNPTTRWEEQLSKEPRYRSKAPLYAAASFGSGEDNRYTMVLDELRGTGRGYDTLYVDRNNNEDLTDDPRIMGRITQRDPLTGRFGPIQVMVDYGDRTVPYYFSMMYYHFGHEELQRGNGYVQDFQLTLLSAGYYTGAVSFGDTEYRIAVVDFNSNGVFNERFKAQSNGPDDQFYTYGDQVLVDVNDDGMFEAGYNNDKESYPYAGYLEVDGKWYSLNTSIHGGTVAVREPDLKLGILDVGDQSSSGSLLLASANGVLRVKTGQQIRVPADTYWIYSHSTSVWDSSGDWRFDARVTNASKKFQVMEGNKVEVKFGAPLVINVRSVNRSEQSDTAKAGDTVRLALTVSGQGGEDYTDITRNDTRPPAPTFKAVDEDGKVVAEGAFEYG